MFKNKKPYSSNISLICVTCTRWICLAVLQVKHIHEVTKYKGILKRKCRHFPCGAAGTLSHMADSQVSIVCHHQTPFDNLVILRFMWL